jgi:hypothetical protein
MRKLGAIVGILLRIVGNDRQVRSLRSTIAFQFVRDDAERFRALTSHQSAKESLGCMLIAARLQQNIDDITVLIHGTPKILLQALDFHEDFVQIPGIAEATLPPLQLSSIVGTELLTPMSNGFIRDDNAAFGQKIFDIPKAHAKAMIDPHSVADDFRRETVSVVTGSRAFHDRILSQLPAQVDSTVRWYLSFAKTRNYADAVDFWTRRGQSQRLMLKIHARFSRDG